METKSCEKVAPGFSCITCDYYTIRKSSYDKHITTLKHCQLTKGNTKVAKSCTPDNAAIFSCDFCDKHFKSRGGLWKHKKKCCNKTNDTNNKDLIMLLIKENSEFKNMIIKVLDNGTHNTTNNTNNTNNSNNNFNLNVYLNETCKNAMNINEFADSLQLQMSDLENVGESGYIEGISSIIIKKLNTLDITERPIHCTDKKRETMYIKDQDKWEKEDEKKTKMHKLVTKVANKNITMISEFQKLHPEWKKCSSKYADQHNKIVIESMGGKGDNEYEKQEKIIKKIAKEVFVEKCL